MDRVYAFFSFIFSLLLYLSLLFFTFYFFLASQQKPKRFTTKPQAIEVILTEPKSPSKPKQLVSPSKRFSKMPVKKTKSSKGSKSPKIKEGIKSLFATLTPSQTAKKEFSSRKKEQPSRLKGRGAKDILQSLKSIRFEQKSAAASGEKDPYLAKIYKLLYTNWIPSPASVGGRAKVRIVISKDGKIEYTILQRSDNESFNSELKSYLEYLKSLTFPKPSKKMEFSVYFEAKE